MELMDCVCTLELEIDIMKPQGMSCEFSYLAGDSAAAQLVIPQA
jgi:hypothetical protein